MSYLIRSMRKVSLPKRDWVDHPLVNFLWFYSVWLTCVLGKNDTWVLALMLIGVHYLFVKNRLNEIYFATISLVIGVTTDAILSYFNIFIFEGNELVPIWLVVLWLGFPSTLNRGLKFLKSNITIAVFVGGFGGASSYVSGMYFGAVEFSYSLMTTSIILVIHWGILIPVLLAISKWFPLDSNEAR